MKTKIATLLVIFTGLLIVMAGTASALTINDSSSFNITLNDGAYITDNNAQSNLFNANKLINMNDGTETNDGVSSGSVKHANPYPFHDIPYVDVGGTRYFQLLYDMQETSGGGRSLSIDDIIITAGVSFPPAPATGGTVVWDYDQASYGSIVLNSQAPYSDRNLRAGGDMALYLPVSLFAGLNLTGSSLLTMTVTQSSSDNGDDEWVVFADGNFYNPGDPIPGDTPYPVPEPSTVVLFGSGLLGLCYAGMRRNRH